MKDSGKGYIGGLERSKAKTKNNYIKISKVKRKTMHVTVGKIKALIMAMLMCQLN